MAGQDRHSWSGARYCALPHAGQCLNQGPKIHPFVVLDFDVLQGKLQTIGQLILRIGRRGIGGLQLILTDG